MTVRRAQRRWLGTIIGVATNDNVAAITFDDGPHPEFTPKLLELLRLYEAKATFFMVGEAAERYPGLVAEVARAGHAIGNHTWDHRSLPLLSRSKRFDQIRRWESATAPFGLPLLRPPYGHQSLATRLDAFWLGYRVVTWSIVADDWLKHDAEWMAQKVINDVGPGSIILFHDAIYRQWKQDGIPNYDRTPMLAALGSVLDNLNGRYRFVTVPELLQLGKPLRRYWIVGDSDDWKSLASRW
jgi:peptidoglycan/xylan/chitin deacetylase (PgdA/CDA1 family)